MGYMLGTSVHGLMVIMVCHDLMLLQCRCMEITEKGYTAIAAGCPKLQVLRMYACAHVNDATLQACGQLLPDLRVIDICGAHLVTDNGAQVSSGCSVKIAPHSLYYPHCNVLYPVRCRTTCGWMRPLLSQQHNRIVHNAHAARLVMFMQPTFYIYESV